jgi:amino acid transporter
VATPPEFKNSASYVFGHFENCMDNSLHIRALSLTGYLCSVSLWPSGFAFLLSFLAPAWVIGGTDSSVHISEEVKNANVAVPRAMILSTALGCIFGWGTYIFSLYKNSLIWPSIAFTVSVAFNMGTDMQAILDNPIGQPMATV